MPEIQRPDGAIIHYAVFGRGFPLLCLAPGGVNSEIACWQRRLINPVREFSAGAVRAGGLQIRATGE